MSATKTPPRVIVDIAQTLIGAADANVVACPVGIYIAMYAVMRLAKTDSEPERATRTLLADPTEDDIDAICKIINSCSEEDVIMRHAFTAETGEILTPFATDLLTTRFNAEIKENPAYKMQLLLEIGNAFDGKWHARGHFKTEDVYFQTAREVKKVRGFKGKTDLCIGKGKTFKVAKLPYGKDCLSYAYVVDTTAASVDEIITADFGPVEHVKFSMPCVKIVTGDVYTDKFAPWAHSCGDIFNHLYEGASPVNGTSLDVLQICAINVDEEGTKAVSVTRLPFAFGSAPDFTIDKPFTFLIVPAGARFPIFCLKCFDPRQ